MDSGVQYVMMGLVLMKLLLSANNWVTLHMLTTVTLKC